MSVSSLPGYVRHTSLSRIPSYSAEPQAYEQRLAWTSRNPSARPTAEFVKQSKNGSISLRLKDQERNAALPVYGCGAIVSGAVDLTKVDTVIAVEVKIEGSLHLKEIAEGGTTSHKLCLSRLTLWSRDRHSEPCPSSLPFSLSLPATFSDGKDAYSLPPTHEVHLSGVPGFRATIDYSVTANVHKTKSASLLPIKNNPIAHSIDDALYSGIKGVLFARTHPFPPVVHFFGAVANNLPAICSINDFTVTQATYSNTDAAAVFG
ncbi:hypothetical protein EUX98_g7367 [Antrodiella citrinella]|uniref:Arrestin-like N-terminal domain-containing protein n=1 Tax=Antrodiella citrinella TaxID=2447956 RepID=A0A4S4MLZ9_9APHY|nr:hypothetical protein EUX98_g7367 [Antrodiella citrinella]